MREVYIIYIYIIFIIIHMAFCTHGWTSSGNSGVQNIKDNRDQSRHEKRRMSLEQGTLRRRVRCKEVSLGQSALPVRLKAEKHCRVVG